MSDVVVKYRPRSVSKLMVGVFVVLLLVPTVIAVVAATLALFHGDQGVRPGKLIKTLLFAGGLCVVIFRPSGRITIDRQAGMLRYTKGWSSQAAGEFPLAGLAAVSVEAHPGGSLHRLLLAYRDGTTRPLSETFYYGADHHQGVARALNAAIAAHASATSAWNRA